MDGHFVVFAAVLVGVVIGALLTWFSTRSKLEGSKLIGQIIEQNRSNLSDILGPLNAKLQEFENKVVVVHEDEIRYHERLFQQIKQLTDLNQTVIKETEDLTKALTSFCRESRHST